MRVFESAYMRWVKTREKGRLDLTGSGVPGVSLADLGARIEDLEINRASGGYGHRPLLEAISHEYGVPVESIVAGGGASGANQYAFSLMLGPGDEVLIEHPAYDILPNLALFTGAAVTRFYRRPEHGWAIDAGEIADLMTPHTKLIVLTNLHNPSSALTDLATLRRVGKIAAARGAYVLVDEVYLDCVWDARPRSSFFLGPNFIVTSSLTKIYGVSGLRCGWIFASPDIADRMWRLIDLFDNIPAHPAELLSVMTFQKLGMIRKRSQGLIETNRGIYREMMGEAPRHGTVVFPQLPGLDVDILLEKYETAVVPGRFFEMPDRVRVSFGCATRGFARGSGAD